MFGLNFGWGKVDFRGVELIFDTFRCPSVE